MRWFFSSLLALLWLATLVVLVAWAQGFDLGFDPEPVTGLLGSASAALTGLVSYFGVQLQRARRDLEEERFSTPMALAYGYVNNFLEPAVTALLKQAADRHEQIQLHVFIPERLEELLPASRQRILARIRSHSFRGDIINLEFEEGRARDVITITHTDGLRPLYFDFPTTLLTLRVLVDYKVESAPDQFDTAARDALGRAYIAHFREALERRIDALELGDYVFFTDRNLAFLEIARPSDPAS